jgi:hypothetical protein
LLGVFVTGGGAGFSSSSLLSVSEVSLLDSSASAGDSGAGAGVDLLDAGLAAVVAAAGLPLLGVAGGAGAVVEALALALAGEAAVLAVAAGVAAGVVALEGFCESFFALPVAEAGFAEVLAEDDDDELEASAADSFLGQSSGCERKKKKKIDIQVKGTR